MIKKDRLIPIMEAFISLEASAAIMQIGDRSWNLKRNATIMHLGLSFFFFVCVCVSKPGPLFDWASLGPDQIFLKSWSNDKFSLIWNINQIGYIFDIWALVPQYMEGYPQPKHYNLKQQRPSSPAGAQLHLMLPPVLGLQHPL